MSRILICSSNPGLNDFLCDLLSVEGYEVEVTPTAKEGIEKILSKRFRVAIVGLEFEGMSGLEMISIIHKIDINIPVITISKNDSLETERLVRQERVFYYFLEPVDGAEMKAVVSYALKKYPEDVYSSGGRR
jgi:DNA-binding response OmpR family regulator